MQHNETVVRDIACDALETFERERERERETVCVRRKEAEVGLVESTGLVPLLESFGSKPVIAGESTLHDD